MLVLALDPNSILNLGFTVSKIRELVLSGVLSRSGYPLLLESSNKHMWLVVLRKDLQISKLHIQAFKTQFGYSKVVVKKTAACTNYGYSDFSLL